MHNRADGYKYVLTLVIVEFGMGSRIMEESKKVGVTGGTVFLGKGTVRNPILKMLGLDEARKEIVLMITPHNLEDIIHDHLTDRFQMHKPNHGIIVTMPVSSVFGLHDLTENDSRTGGSTMDYEAIYTVVEKGLGQEVVDAATTAGSTGATIINARGSGIHENAKFFAMNIEPEKEIVMIIIEKDRAENVVNAIRDAMHIDEPGKGIMFTMDINRVTGLLSRK
jgi:nitrogen regulatory protein PII